MEPISLPISNHLVKSPTSFSVVNFIALCLGATNHEFVKHVTIELLLGISSNPVRSGIAKYGSILKDYELVKQIVASNVSGRNETNWMLESNHIHKLLKNAKKQFQVNKNGQIMSGSILGAAQSERHFGPLVRPVVNCVSEIIKGKPLNSELRSLFIIEIIKLLDFIKNDKMSLLPLWVDWFRKFVDIEENSQLDLELRTTEGFVQKIQRSQKSLISFGPHQNEVAYNRWCRLK